MAGMKQKTCADCGKLFPITAKNYSINAGDFVCKKCSEEYGNGKIVLENKIISTPEKYSIKIVIEKESILTKNPIPADLPNKPFFDFIASRASKVFVEHADLRKRISNENLPPNHQICHKAHKLAIEFDRYNAQYNEHKTPNMPDTLAEYIDRSLVNS